MTHADAHERAKERALPSLWAERHRRIGGQPWSFRGREYLRDIHDDRAREVVVEKGAQLGFTEAMQNLLAHSIDFGTDAMVVFPTDDTAKRHSKARFAALLESSPYLEGLFKEVNAVDVKRAQEAALYFEGSNSGDALYSVPVGFLVIDEVDRCDQPALEAAEHRLDGHASPCAFYVSTPTVPDFGINKRFQDSDRKRWHVPCPRCDWRGPLADAKPELESWACIDWRGKPEIPKDRDEAWKAALTAAIRCPGCGHRWSESERRAAVDAGCWVAENPGAPVSGYSINQLCSPTQTPTDIVWRYFRAKADLNPEKLVQYVNQVLGLPFLGESDRITPEMVRELTVPATARASFGTCLGADPGKVIHVAQGERDGDGRLVVRRYLELPGWEALERVIRDEGILRAVVDRYPEAAKSEELCQAFPSVVYRAEHPEGMREMYTWDPKRQVVQIREVDAVDVLMARIRRKTLLIERRELWELAVDHLPRIATTMAMDRHGVPVRRVLHKIGGRDDCALATIYLDAASSLVATAGGDPQWDEDRGLQKQAEAFGEDLGLQHPVLAMADVDVWDEARLEWESF